MSTNENNRETEKSEFVREIMEALENLSFGQVVITVHDSKVVQMDRTEKTRFEKGGGFPTK